VKEIEHEDNEWTKRVVQRNSRQMIVSFGLQISGIVILSQAFPVLASRIWSWIISLSLGQILLGVAGYWIYGLGNEYGREQLLSDPDIQAHTVGENRS